MNIYCFSTLSFAKLQFKSVINKAFHKHGVASFTDAWIETVNDAGHTVTTGRIFYRCVDWNYQHQHATQEEPLSHLLQMRGLKLTTTSLHNATLGSHLLQMRGLKPNRPTSLNTKKSRIFYRCVDWNPKQVARPAWEPVASFTDAWIETNYPSSERDGYRCRIFYRCVDWNDEW